MNVNVSVNVIVAQNELTFIAIAAKSTGNFTHTDRDNYPNLWKDQL